MTFFFRHFVSFLLHVILSILYPPLEKSSFGNCEDKSVNSVRVVSL